MEKLLEVIAYTIESCHVAEAAGAARIELCDNVAEGGTTPSYGFIKKARQSLHIELYPIIRPRGGDFLYSDAEFDMMKTDVQMCKTLGCDGVSIGLLKADGSVDKEKCFQLVELAYPLGVTFHRAFDRTNDPFKAMEDIIECGFERILTSGQQPTAGKGVKLISSLVQRAGERIIIMPGSGVRANNILAIAEKTGATEFHSSAAKTINSKMNFRNKGMKENLVSPAADGEEISRMVKLIHQPTKS